MLKKGELINLIVEQNWAEVVRANELLGDPAEDSIGGSPFVVRVSQSDDLGIWVEKVRHPRSRKRIASKVLVPWQYVLAVATHPICEADRNEIGFERSGR